MRLIGQTVLNRFSTNRRRHLPTVAVEHPSWAATVWLSEPSAHLKMILDRKASDCADFDRRDHPSNCSRSASVKVRLAFGRPVRGHAPFYDLSNEFLAGDTSVAEPNLFTVRAAQARTSRRSPRSTYDPVSLPRRPCDPRT